MLAACEATVKGGCALADPNAPNDDAAVAVVTWEDEDHRHARIEVGLRKRSERPAHWLTRTLSLTDNDAVSERWRAVGLVIATLVDEEIRAAAAPPPPNPSPSPSPKPSPSPSPKPSPPPPPSPRLRAWIDLTALGAPALDSGSFFAGGMLRGAWYPARAPIFVTLGFAYATTPVDSTGLRVDSIAATLGAGASFRTRRFLFDGSIVFRLERVGASVDSGGASDAASVIIPAGQLGVDVGWAPSRVFALVLGLDGELRAQAVTVQVRGIAAGRALPVGGDLHAGVRFSL